MKKKKFPDDLRMDPAVDEGDFTTVVRPDKLLAAEESAEFRMLQILMESALMQTPWIRGFRPEPKVGVLLKLAAHSAVAGSMTRAEILEAFDRYLDQGFQEAEDWNNDVNGIRTQLQAEFAQRAAERRIEKRDPRDAKVVVVVEQLEKAKEEEWDEADLDNVRTTLFGGKKKPTIH